MRVNSVETKVSEMRRRWCVWSAIVRRKNLSRKQKLLVLEEQSRGAVEEAAADNR